MDLKSRILDEVKKRKLEREFVQQRNANMQAENSSERKLSPEKSTDFSEFNQYKNIELHKLAAEKLQIASPFFKEHDGLSSATSIIAGREFVNFSSYDYLV